MRLSSWHFAVLLLTLGLNGCAFWDEVTTRTMPRSWKDPKDPLVVLRDSSNGDQRARALQILREPKQHNGDEETQDMVVKVLTTSATKDAQPLCRLSAIETLGSFKDPRAVTALKDAYFQAATFPADTATVIQVAALEALGRTRQPEAVPILSMVVREPAPALTVPLVEKRQAADRKTAAVRAPGQLPATWNRPRRWCTSSRARKMSVYAIAPTNRCRPRLAASCRPTPRPGKRSWPKACPSRSLPIA